MTLLKAFINVTLIINDFTYKLILLTNDLTYSINK